MIEPKDRAYLALAHTRLYVGLSSGAVILVATFLRDLFTHPVLRPLLLIAVVSFAICIGATMLVMSAVVEFGVEDTKTDSLSLMQKIGTKRTSHIGEISFFLGLICLCVFVIYNLYFLGSP